jgi:riboflavin biosynthesis pyrimidine reductase
VAGRSGELGGPGDQQVFRALRAACDVILVGAGTLRAERYGPPRLDDTIQDRRVLAGQTALPRLAVVSRSLALDLTSALFTTGDPPPLVITAPGADQVRRVEVARVADLLLAGQGDEVDLEAAMASLGEMDVEVVVCEGGPRLNGGLFDADLIDEVCVTIAPTLVGGTSARLTSGARQELPRGFELAHLLEHEGELYLRAVRADGDTIGR